MASFVDLGHRVKGGFPEIRVRVIFVEWEQDAGASEADGQVSHRRHSEQG